jgi:hypothetical protein
MKKEQIPQFRSSSTYELGQLLNDYEQAVGISATVPDQTISLRELISNHTRGLPIPEFLPLFSEEEIPDINKMDLTEIDELRRSLRTEIDWLQEGQYQNFEEQIEEKTNTESGEDL